MNYKEQCIKVFFSRIREVCPFKVLEMVRRSPVVLGLVCGNTQLDFSYTKPFFKVESRDNYSKQYSYHAKSKNVVKTVATRRFDDFYKEVIKNIDGDTGWSDLFKRIHNQYH